MLPLIVNACGPLVRLVGFSVNTSRFPDVVWLNAVPSRRTEQVGQVKSMLLPPLRESVISDASATEPRFNEKLNTSVTVRTVAGLREFPNVPETGGVRAALTAGAGDKTTAAAFAA